MAERPFPRWQRTGIIRVLSTATPSKTPPQPVLVDPHCACGGPRCTGVIGEDPVLIHPEFEEAD